MFAIKIHSESPCIFISHILHCTIKSLTLSDLMAVLLKKKTEQNKQIKNPETDIHVNSIL